MEFAFLGWPADGPTLRLDYRRFAYAGKFVMSNTGKAVAREGGEKEQSSDGCRTSTDRSSDGCRTSIDRSSDGCRTSIDRSSDGCRTSETDASEFAEDVVAAIAFNADRTDASTAWLRYVTVREDWKREEIGPRLCSFTVERLLDRFERVKIAVNNPFAYEALHKVGFGYIGEETGVAELVLAYPGPRSRASYQAGLARYRERDLSPEEEAFLAAREEADPPAAVHEPSRAGDE